MVFLDGSSIVELDPPKWEKIMAKHNKRPHGPEKKRQKKREKEARVLKNFRSSFAPPGLGPAASLPLSFRVPCGGARAAASTGRARGLGPPGEAAASNFWWSLQSEKGHQLKKKNKNEFFPLFALIRPKVTFLG